MWQSLAAHANNIGCQLRKTKSHVSRPTAFNLLNLHKEYVAGSLKKYKYNELVSRNQSIINYIYTKKKYKFVCNSSTPSDAGTNSK